MSAKRFRYVYVRPNLKESCGAKRRNSLLGFTALCTQNQTKKKFESVAKQRFQIFLKLHNLAIYLE
ncbi:hypothetical protein PseudUWO311_12510 [Pseudanabaena sp. UWO311]|nr:hypothetical protein PseudUWO311_12510 [Pseudanabaena sp. UWO311]